MARRTVTIVSTGVANLASVVAAVRREGGAPIVTDAPSMVINADLLVLPGVGAFAAAMRLLRANGLTAPLRDRIDAGRPTLAICLGLQILCSSSEESPGCAGIGAIEAPCRRFQNVPRVPQMGWNHVAPSDECKLLRPGYAYFANSFAAGEQVAGWHIAWSDFGGRFVAALERGRVIACQFHPELSGEYGASLLRRWMYADVESPMSEAAAC
jgi:imidazole glycerol phosphate synthase glutamine amidotransferase subunit